MSDRLFNLFSGRQARKAAAVMVTLGMIVGGTTAAAAASNGASAAHRTVSSGSRAAAFRLEEQLDRAIAKTGAWNQIVRKPNGQLHHQYLIPGAEYYELFDWDTYFMGVALSYHHRGRSLEGSVKDFLHFTDHYVSYPGYTPREVDGHHMWALPEMCKPFLAQMALRATLTMHHVAWLRPYYHRLADTIRYWRNARRATDGLFTWFDGVESGTDNSPAVIYAPADCTEGVDLACYIYREYLAMADLDIMLKKTADAKRYEQHAAKLKRLIQTRLWDADAGTFYNRNSRTGKFIKVPEWTNLTPLWAGVATPQQAHILITRWVLNPHRFWTRFGIRSLTPGSPSYHPVHGYWQGPIWIISNYMVMHGLMNYGYTSQARLLARETARMLLRDIKKTGGMHETYNPNTGVGQNEGNFKSWDLLGAYMIREAYNGIDAAAIPATGSLRK